MPVNIVIGSGPTGVAAASAIIARGDDVLMVDVGVELEPSKAARRARMGLAERSQWQRVDLDALTTMARRSSRPGTIRPYGSDFLFRIPAAASEWSEQASSPAVRPSFAKGELSNGWGASVLPYRDGFISGNRVRPSRRVVVAAQCVSTDVPTASSSTRRTWSTVYARPEG